MNPHSSEYQKRIAELEAINAELVSAIEGYFIVWANEGKKPGWCDRVDIARDRIRDAIAKSKGGQP